MDRLPRALVLRFATYHDDLAGPRLEAVLDNAADGARVIAAPLRDVAAWLAAKGYRWCIATNGIWEKAA